MTVKIHLSDMKSLLERLKSKKDVADLSDYTFPGAIGIRYDNILSKVQQQINVANIIDSTIDGGVEIIIDYDVELAFMLALTKNDIENEKFMFG